jgi:hypothetical protein
MPSTKTLSGIVGAIYLVLGITGLVTGASALGFDANLTSNIVNLVIGLFGVGVYAGTVSNPRQYMQGVGVVTAALAVGGLAATSLSFIPLSGSNMWLHVVTAVVALYAGFVGTQQGTTTHPA